MEQPDYEILFEMPVELGFAKSEGEGRRRCLKGFGQTEALDHDREQILKSGVDFSYFRDEGFLNYDHQRRVIGGVKMPLIIGFPTLVEMRDRGMWIEGELLQGSSGSSEQIRMANEMWELGHALQKSGGNRRLAYSVEGPPPVRRGNKIVQCTVTAAAVTHKPVNPTCSIEVFAKSLCCGRCSPIHPLYNPAHHCGNKHVEDVEVPALEKALEPVMGTESAGSLLKENIDRNISKVMYGDKECGCYDAATGCFSGGVQGAAKHMTDCLGHSHNDSIRFLRKIVRGSQKSADLAALAKTAGLIRQ